MFQNFPVILGCKTSWGCTFMVCGWSGITSAHCTVSCILCSCSVLPINDSSRECTPTPTASERPESSAIGLRFAKAATPLPRTLDHQIPPTPGHPTLTSNRLISSRMTNRRNINTATLKPLEKPKTPALVPIDTGIRGFRLATYSSPPSTPFVRHTQLPPLEGGGFGGPDPSLPPNAQLRASAQRNRVTFSSRIVSAADGSELWHLSRPAVVGELRPSTTSTSSRHVADAQKSSLGRKVSDNHLHFGHMKVVGYAAGFHGGGAGGGAEQARDKMSSTAITEDEEVVAEEEMTSFAVTGKAGIFRELFLIIAL